MSNTTAWFTWWGVRKTNRLFISFFNGSCRNIISFSIVLVGAAWEITTSDKRIARSKYNFMISFLKREGSILWYRILKVVQVKD
jgi:hypothetical protein